MLFEWWERYRKMILSIGALLFVGSSIWLYQIQKSDATSKLPLEAPAFAVQELPAEESIKSSSQKPAGKKETIQEPAPVMVDVKGKVKKPGLYRFDPGMRVADAISAAGGALPDADLEQINLASPLADGSAIVIPAKGAALGTNSPPPLPIGIARQAAASPAKDKSVNINTATLEELMTLPGIGEARAKAIVTYRTEKNGFRSPDELKKIGGIGDKMYARIQDLIRIQ